MKITKEQLQKVIAKASDELVDSINQTAEKYQIDTKERLAAFIAQIAHESGEFVFNSENLNYSAESLVKVFGKYFTAASAQSFARKPEAIANRVYANRMGNGTEASGDGFKFRGRGYMQLTGKSNYEAFGDLLGVDFTETPDLVATAPYNVLSAGWFWDKNQLNALADKGDFTGITKRINGGTNGLEHRQAYYNKLKSAL